MPRLDVYKRQECAHLPSSISRYPYLKHKGTLLRNGIEMIKNANVVMLATGDTIEAVSYTHLMQKKYVETWILVCIRHLTIYVY